MSTALSLDTWILGAPRAATTISSRPFYLPDGWVLADEDHPSFVACAQQYAFGGQCLCGSGGGGRVPYSSSKCTGSRHHAVKRWDPHHNKYAYCAGHGYARVLLVKSSPRTAVCKATGDPHYRSYKGLRYNYYGAGPHMMGYIDPDDNIYTSYGMAIQTYMSKWKNYSGSPTVNAQAAMRVFQDNGDDCTIEVHAPSTYWGDPTVIVNEDGVGKSSADFPDLLEGTTCGSTLALTKVSKWWKGSTYVEYSLGPQDDVFTFGGATLTLQLRRSSFQSYWQVYVSLQEDVYGMYGLCGRFSDDHSDLTLPDGTEASLPSNRYAGELGSYYAADGEPYCSIFWADRELDRCYDPEELVVVDDEGDDPDEDPEEEAAATLLCEQMGYTDVLLADCVEDVLTGGDDEADNAGEGEDGLEDVEEEAGVECSAMATPTSTVIVGAREYAILDGSSLWSSDSSGCWGAKGRLPTTGGWSLAPDDSTSVSAIRLIEMPTGCVVTAGKGYVPGLGIECAEEDELLVTEQAATDGDVCYSMSACPGRVLIYRPYVSDSLAASVFGELTDDTDNWWRESDGEEFTAVETVGDADKVAIYDAMGVDYEADTVLYALTATNAQPDEGTADEGAYHLVGVAAEDVADYAEQVITITACALLDGLMDTGLPLTDSDTFSLYIDANYTDPSAETETEQDETAMDLWGLAAAFDPGYDGWQCRSVDVPCQHPSLYQEGTRDIEFWVHLEYSMEAEDGVTYPSVQFVLADVSMGALNYIQDPYFNDWYVETETPSSYAVYGAAWLERATGDGVLITPTDVSLSGIQQSVYITHTDDGADICGLELRACGDWPVIHADYVDSVLAFALYADIRYNDDTWSYGWIQSFDSDCVSMLLPGVSPDNDAAYVTGVEVHALSNGAMTQYRVYDLTLSPIMTGATLCSSIPAKTALASGDPHLQTLMGHYYDYFTDGDSLLLEAPLGDSDRVRVEMRARAVATEAVEVEPTISTAVSIGWDSPDYTAMALAAIEGMASYDSVVAVDCQGESPTVTYNGDTIDLDVTSHTVGSAVLGVTGYTDPDTYSETTTATVVLYLSLAVSGLTIDISVNRSTSGILYLDTGAAASTVFLDNAQGLCTGCFGTCTSLDADTAYVTDTVQTGGALLDTSSTMLPTLSTSTLPTLTPLTEDEATTLCEATGLEDDALTSCIYDAMVLGEVPPSSTFTAYFSSTSSALGTDPVDEPDDPDDTTSTTDWYYIGGATLTAIGVLVGGAYYLSGAEERRRKGGSVSRRRGGKKGRRHKRLANSTFAKASKDIDTKGIDSKQRLEAENAAVL
ncbi:hypothetical protein KIPB_004776 [Kipferlia bialata]|uniref:VWFD domain-containing protein n=1 Tax=Kipferlia bialata TaxID=797122 RepID=A0A9K3CVY1_9EUKA|nr:hypothetical protein KIPB_001995 [Kipferlia bialata]GIQ83452.1 hypothetical protein KIPB_004776 [Kipferlia bialata]|eukprot:g1995.t1